MLIVTNGDAAVGALRGAGFDEPLLAWSDVLHEGPVPAGLSLEELSSLRARYLSDRGWGPLHENLESFRRRDHRVESLGAGDEVLLWFEHDLYDQLQLIQLLDLFGARPDARRPRLRMICEARFVAQLEPEAMRQIFQQMRSVEPQDFELGIRSWAAFRSPSPGALEGVANTASKSVPHLAPALRRLIEEYPEQGSGLARSQRQILEAVRDPGGAPVEAFRHCQQREEAPYLGDTSFWSYLEQLSSGPRPLVRSASGTPFRAPRFGGRPSADPLRLTSDGEDVLAGRADLVRLQGIDRWLGGVHLRTGDLWRRRPRGRLVREESDS